MSAWLSVFMVALAAAGLWIAKEMLKQAIEHEYDAWGAAVARALVRIAGRVHPDRAKEWRNDVLYLQADGETGLVEAVQHVVAAPRLRLRARRGGRAERSTVVGVSAELPPLLGEGRGFLGDGLGSWIRRRADDCADYRDLEETIRMVAEHMIYSPYTVHFYFEESGQLRGWSTGGPHTDAVVTTADYYVRNRDRFLECTDDVYVIAGEMVADFQYLAETSDNFDVGRYEDSILTVSFVP